jgi:hypothetical protein
VLPHHGGDALVCVLEGAHTCTTDTGSQCSAVSEKSALNAQWQGGDHAVSRGPAPSASCKLAAIERPLPWR